MEAEPIKVDVVMWAKNGSRTLPLVLKRIEKAIPKKCIVSKIFVDDKSVDNTVEIAKRFKWDVYENKEGFVRGGVKEALKHVTAPFFVSVEQDVVLAENWWKCISKYMHNPEVAVAQGIRVNYPGSKSLNCLEKYTLERFPEFGPKSRASLDNNIFRTAVIRKIGVPEKYPIYVDAALYEEVLKAGYKWTVDENVISHHLWKGTLSILLHRHKHMSLRKLKHPLDDTTLLTLLKILMFSPLRASHVMIKERCPTIPFVYPFMRLMAIEMYFERKKRRPTLGT